MKNNKDISIDASLKSFSIYMQQAPKMPHSTCYATRHKVHKRLICVIRQLGRWYLFLKWRSINVRLQLESRFYRSYCAHRRLSMKKKRQLLSLIVYNSNLEFA